MTAAVFNAASHIGLADALCVNIRVITTERDDYILSAYDRGSGTMQVDWSFPSVRGTSCRRIDFGQHSKWPRQQTVQYLIVQAGRLHYDHKKSRRSSSAFEDQLVLTGLRPE